MSTDAFVVLGMHKSGTSLVAQALHASGVTMLPSEPQGIYPREKYEWPAFKALNYRLLRVKPEDSLGSDLPPRLYAGTGTVDAACKLISETQADHLHWGFKDPRTVLTYSFWRKHLPPHRLVAIRRDPKEVIWRYALNGFDTLAARRQADIYATYLTEHLAAASVPCIELDFTALRRSDDEWARFTAFVGRDVPDVRYAI